MFVGGLNWDTSDEGLRSYFSQFGKVEACTIMRDPQGRSRGFAFLTFEDPAAVNKVMVQEHFLDGKIIDPKRAIPRTEHQRTVKMFVGGLAPSVTNDTMRDYFSQFGKVIDCTVMVDRDSSRSKGFGFVTFDDQSGAERLFGMPGLQIDGKTIEVKQAQPRSGMATDRNNNNNMGNNNNHRGGAPAYGNNNFNSNAAAAGNTPFDPQALATLYQRMAQLTGAAQGGMGWNMGTGMGMNPAMGGMGMMNGGMMGAGMMGAGGGGGMGMGGGMRNGGMNNGMGGMGGNDGRANGMGGHSGTAPMRGGNIPRGPAAMRGGMQGGGGGGGMMGVPTGPSGGLGPARMGRGHQHNYHPYSR
ncbi:hypothetical protein FRB91_000833 [Serendipita sp. 411]|nr:hypothetical protein FRC16_001379 [Serendipita sp. 398]KAG8846421.1 hypothetical protein FRB91_000833 [Serendipita sp. 411]KAG8854506.1 hypothetical protein FRC20_000985 [Serendipita sp. 405]